MNIEIRRARLDEMDALTELSLSSKQSNGYDDAFMAACREELTVTRDRMLEGEYWVAEADGLRGCACLAVDQDGRSAEVHAFFIDPNSKRKGIGRLLWTKLLQRAREQGVTALRLDADPYAVPFYEAIGFRTVGESPSGSIPGRAIPHMTMLLK